MFYLIFCGHFSKCSTFLKGLFVHEVPKAYWGYNKSSDIARTPQNLKKNPTF